MNGKSAWCRLVVLGTVACLWVGCRKTGEDGGERETANRGAPKATPSRVPMPPKADHGDSGAPSKLARERGRKADGRKAPETPQPPEYQVGVPIPGKPGFVFNPFTNNPVDVRGIPPGTLVRDPGDPDADHMFRIAEGAAENEEVNDGDLTEIPVPEIP